MKTLWEDGVLQRLLLLVLLSVLLGVSPFPREVGIGFQRAHRALTFDAPSEAASSLARIAELLPWRADLWEEAGHQALAGGAPQQALSFFQEAAARGTLSPGGYLAWGDALQQSGNDYTAAQVWEITNQVFGPSEEALIRLADLHQTARNWPALIDTLKQLLAWRQSLPANRAPAGPSPWPRVEIYHQLGLLLAAYQPASAPPYLLEAVELNPELASARQLAFAIQRALPQDNPAYTFMVAGQKLADLGHWELAAQAFRHAIEINPDYAEAWAFLGEALQHTGSTTPTEAYTSLERALSLDPLSLPAHIFLSLYWHRQGDLPRAIRHLTRAAEIDPRNPTIQIDLGAAFALSGDLERALSHYQQAVELTSRSPKALRSLIEFCLRYNTNVRTLALPLARELNTRYPAHPDSADTMGQVLFQLGDLANAARFYHRALALDPQFAPAHLHLGILYSLQGETSAALDHLALVLRLAPNTPLSDHANRLLESLISR